MSNRDPFNAMPGSGWDHTDRPLSQGRGTSAWVLLALLGIAVVLGIALIV